MKKYLHLFLLLFVFSGILNAQSSPALTANWHGHLLSPNSVTFTVGDLNYSVNDDNVSVTVTGHVDGYNATGPLVIPESVSYEGHDYAVQRLKKCRGDSEVLHPVRCVNSAS